MPTVNGLESGGPPVIVSDLADVVRITVGEP
jgi:hypothetical protein